MSRCSIVLILIAISGCSDGRGKAIGQAVTQCEQPVKMTVGATAFGGYEIKFECNLKAVPEVKP